MKFNVGDKVRVIKARYLPSARVGQEGVIFAVGPTQHLRYSVKFADGKWVPYYGDELELVEEQP